MTVKGAYWTGMDGTPCPRSGLNESQDSTGAPEGNPVTDMTRHEAETMARIRDNIVMRWTCDEMRWCDGMFESRNVCVSDYECRWTSGKCWNVGGWLERDEEKRSSLLDVVVFQPPSCRTSVWVRVGQTVRFPLLFFSLFFSRLDSQFCEVKLREYGERVSEKLNRAVAFKNTLIRYVFLHWERQEERYERIHTGKIVWKTRGWILSEWFVQPKAKATTSQSVVRGKGITRWMADLKVCTQEKFSSLFSLSSSSVIHSHFFAFSNT